MMKKFDKFIEVIDTQY